MIFNLKVNRSKIPHFDASLRLYHVYDTICAVKRNYCKELSVLEFGKMRPEDKEPLELDLELGSPLKQACSI